MSTADRVIRILIGATLLTIGPLTDIVATDRMSNIILGSLGSVAILSAVFAYCFLYDVTGFNTCKKSDSNT